MKEAMEIEMENMENQSHTEELKPLHIFTRARTPVTLTFEDVKHRISKKRKGFFCNGTKSEERLILGGASGAVLPGEMLVILGPSGSGKTTLLTALGGRLGGKTSGRINYNEKPFSAAIKRNMGFVAQINYFYPHLTVHETLVFAALLRLPGDLAKEEKIMQVEAVINQLVLNQCKNTIVGGKFVRGISGGERKRLGIGEEMLRNPSLLFLDEPTSGLDSTIANRIVSFLWRLAKGRRTIVMTIHQPSSRLFYMFDKILLLSEGRTVYFGKGEHVMDYFASIGYALSVAMNPSDFLLDLANGVFSGDSKEDIESVKQALISAYESKLVDKLKVELQGIDNVSHTSSEDEEIGPWCTSWQQQFFVLLKRSLKERRHQSYSRLKISQVLAISFLTGLLWWQSTDLPNQVGLLFFYIKFGGFFSVTQNVLNFPRERLVLTKERSSGMYRLSSYFMARTVGDLPMDLALPTLFVIVTYWMGGLQHNATNFFHTLIVLLYTVLVAQSLGLAIGAVVMKQKVAMTVAAVVILSLQLTCGFLVQNVPAFIDWIKYLSLTYYSYKLLLRSQYKPDQRYQCGSNGSCLVKDFHRIKSVGLDEQFLSVVALAFMLVGFRLVAYVALMKVGVIHHRKY